jgi:hypothetical protein
MAAEACGNSLQQWLSLELGKRTRIDNATEENSTRWLERYYCDQDGASDDDAFGNQPSYGPALWQVGEEYGGLSKAYTKRKKNRTAISLHFFKTTNRKISLRFFFQFQKQS